MKNVIIQLQMEILLRLKTQRSQHIYVDYSALQGVSDSSQDKTILVFMELQRRIIESEPIEIFKSPTLGTSLDLDENNSQKAHARHISQDRSSGSIANGDNSTKPAPPEYSASSKWNDQPKEHRRKNPSQKTMLSEALQKADHAVLSDNAQRFEEAISAYADACALLQQVMQQFSGDDDRRKLETVVSVFVGHVPLGQG